MPTVSPPEQRRAVNSISSEETTMEQLMSRPTEQERAMGDAEITSACLKLREAVALREKYRQPAAREPPCSSEPVKPSKVGSTVRGWPFVAPPWYGTTDFGFEMVQGVMHVWRKERVPPGEEPPSPTRRAAAHAPAFTPPPSLDVFSVDLARLCQLCADPAVTSFFYKRLQKLEASFGMYVMENGPSESAEQRADTDGASHWQGLAGQVPEPGQSGPHGR